MQTSRPIATHHGASGHDASGQGFPQRLVTSPVFILSATRSGSTLLRKVLSSHSAIHAGPELHITDVKANAAGPGCTAAMAEIGLRQRDLEYLIWDRILHRELLRSGKRIIVEKTPGNVLVWRRLTECWPQARYLFLLRHPGSVAESTASFLQDHVLPNASMSDLFDERTRRYTSPAWYRTVAVSAVRPMLDALAEAREALPGTTIRYEEFAAEPERIARGLCEYLGVGWEPDMLEYGKADRESNTQFYLGDVSQKITSGRIQPGRPLPSEEDIPPELLDACRTFGYLT
jgi:hypothetical protein